MHNSAYVLPRIYRAKFTPTGAGVSAARNMLLRTSWLASSSRSSENTLLQVSVNKGAGG
jgi:hypothetical protein